MSDSLSPEDVALVYRATTLFNRPANSLKPDDIDNLMVEGRRLLSLVMVLSQALNREIATKAGFRADNDCLKRAMLTEARNLRDYSYEVDSHTTARILEKAANRLALEANK